MVASDATGAADIINPGVEGEIVAAGDVLGLREALDRVLADPIRAKKMGTAARERVINGFDWESDGARAMSAYSKLLVDTDA